MKLDYSDHSPHFSEGDQDYDMSNPHDVMAKNCALSKIDNKNRLK